MSQNKRGRPKKVVEEENPSIVPLPTVEKEPMTTTLPFEKDADPFETVELKAEEPAEEPEIVPTVLTEPGEDEEADRKEAEEVLEAVLKQAEEPKIVEKVDIPDCIVPEKPKFEVKTEKMPEKEPEMVQKTTQEAIEDKEKTLREALIAVLKRPKTRDSIPTFTMYTDRAYFKRYMLLDVDGDAYREAWETYKRLTGTKDANDFLLLVYSILDLELPRLHRAVNWVPLD